MFQILLLLYANKMLTIPEYIIPNFQDLQDEIEKHREMYLSLNSTGKKLMSGLDSQEDATMLHRRLEEMNQRWNYLKAKSIAIRL